MRRGLPFRNRRCRRPSALTQPSGMPPQRVRHSPRRTAPPPDQRDRNATASPTLAHCDAWNHPNVCIVDTRRSAGTIYAAQFMAWGHSNPTNGLAILECKQPGSVGTGSQPSHRCPAPLIDSTRAGQFAHVAVSQARVHAPACGAPTLEGPCPDGPDAPRSKG